MKLQMEDKKCVICKLPTAVLTYVVLKEGLSVPVPTCVNHIPDCVESVVVKNDKIFTCKIDTCEICEAVYAADMDFRMEEGRKDSKIKEKREIGFENTD